MNLIEAMKNCEQTKGQSVYQHGISVRDYYDDLSNIYVNLPTKFNWKLPDFWTVYQNDIWDWSYYEEIMWDYLLYHDCGKPFCKIEIDGKVHFPDHAAKSAEIYQQEFSPRCNDKNEFDYTSYVYNLIRDDMILHTCKSEKLSELLPKWSMSHASSLIISSWCELNSNASMFGGFDTISFKSKFKHLERRTKQVCKFYFGEK